MEWLVKFPESGKEIPCKIVRRAIEEFNLMTKAQIILELEPLSFLTKTLERCCGLDNYFKFKLRLTSPGLKDFSMEILRYGYDVDLRKVDVVLNEEIYEEIQDDARKTNNRKLVVTNGTQFIEFLYEVFSSKKFLDTVSGLNAIIKNK